MTQTKAEHYKRALQTVRQIIGSQPIDVIGAVMVIDHALNGSPDQAADELLNTKPALFLGG